MKAEWQKISGTSVVAPQGERKVIHTDLSYALVQSNDNKMCTLDVFIASDLVSKALIYLTFPKGVITHHFSTDEWNVSCNGSNDGPPYVATRLRFYETDVVQNLPKAFSLLKSVHPGFNGVDFQEITNEILSVVPANMELVPSVAPKQIVATKPPVDEVAQLLEELALAKKEISTLKKEVRAQQRRQDQHEAPSNKKRKQESSGTSRPVYTTRQLIQPPSKLKRPLEEENNTRDKKRLRFSSMGK